MAGRCNSSAHVTDKKMGESGLNADTFSAVNRRDYDDTFPPTIGATMMIPFRRQSAANFVCVAQASIACGASCRINTKKAYSCTQEVLSK